MARARRRRVAADPIYLLRVKPGSERVVNIRLKGAGVRSYCPAVLDFRRGGPMEVILFPGYLFVWIVDQWEFVRSMRGVFGFVRFGERPAVVHEKHVLALRAMEGPTGYIRLRPRLQQGQSVRVGGPEGSLATVTGLDGPTRVKVLLSILGREAEMSILEQELEVA